MTYQKMNQGKVGGPAMINTTEAGNGSEVF